MGFNAADVARRSPPMLAVGPTAPNFTLRDQNRRPVTLSDCRDAENMLLVYFPLAITGLCQGEVDHLRDHLPDFENGDNAALAITVGPAPTHKVWAAERPFCSRCSPTSGRTVRSARPMGCSTMPPVSPTAALSSSTDPG